MMRTKNPRIDIALLRERVADEIIHADAEVDMNQSARALNLHLEAIEHALKLAEERSVPRTVWPDNLKLFPFSISPWLRTVALRILSLAMRDQQEVNAALIRSQRETLTLIHAVLRHLREDGRE
jgi:hypothetical protein